MKILIIEESALARRMVSEELQSAGYELLEAKNAAEAFQILETEPGIGLMTLGVALADADGFDFLASLHEETVQARLRPSGNHDIPAIFVTSNDTDEDRLRGFQVGAADFVQKPWPNGQLQDRVNSILGQDHEFSDLDVLMVDDSPMARGFVRRCLTRLGVTVHEAGDGEAALAHLGQHTVDLVISDLNMPKMNGDLLCLKIRGELGLTDIPLIFLSASDDKRTVLSLFKMGATDFLPKPFIQEELMARVRSHLEHARLKRSLATSPGGVPATKMPLPVPSLDDARVLVVEDAPVSRAVAESLLTKMGCLVTTAENGAVAVNKVMATAKGKPFDLILMDMEMPEMNGLEATRRIRDWEVSQAEAGEHPLPIIALTANDQDSALAACLDAGMNDFMVKPMSVPILKRALEHWIKTQD